MTPNINYWVIKNIWYNAFSPAEIFNNKDHEFVQLLKNLIPLKRMPEVDQYKIAIQFYFPMHLLI